MTPTPDTTPAAVDAMCERLDVFEDWLYANDLIGIPKVQTNLIGAAAMLREVARERDRYRKLASTTHRANMVSMGEADKLKDRIEAAEAEAAALREARMTPPHILEGEKK